MEDTVTNIELDTGGNFNVQESVLINIISGFIFLSIFCGVLYTRDFESNYPASSFYLIYLFLVFGCIASFIKAYRNKTFIIINKNGIHYKGKLITAWINFRNAYIIQEDYNVSNYSAGISDKFKIAVIYLDPISGKNYTQQMIMSASQDKSEYQIISAIEYFSDKDLSLHIH